MTDVAAGKRDYRLDFFRGGALFFIFIDHVPGNFLSNFTLQAYALCDAAEVFIFISGYTAALVYSRASERQGALMASARIWRRVWQLYLAHLCLFMIYNAEVSYTVLRFNNPLFIDELQVGAFLDEPAQAVMRVLLLQFQPTFLDILPLYIMLLLVFPLVLLLMRRNVLAALIPSVLIYCVARWTDTNLPGYPEGHTWTFNPLDWQLLFVIGAAFGHSNAMGRNLLPADRFWSGKWLFRLAVAVALAGFVIKLSWTLHEHFNVVPTLLSHILLPMNKSVLPLVRLADVLALAFLVARKVSRDAVFFRSRVAWLVVLCGQHSLQVFCLSILLAVMGNVVFTVFGDAAGMQVVVNAGGIAMLLGMGLLMAWFNAGGRLPRPAGAEGDG
jgi:hypothetical protein